MSKRKQGASVDDDDSDVSLVDVDFEFFDPNPKLDYHALKRLLGQLLQADADLFHLHDLTELVLSQPLLGTTVKTDGIESDPYAFLTILNMHTHQNHPSIKALIEYAMLKSSPTPPFQAALHSLLGPDALNSLNHVGLVLSERLINMPVQVAPPMYRMLVDEMKWAVEDNEPFNFSHFLFITRIYKLSPEEEEAMQTASHTSKRQKPITTASAPSNGVYSFHPEDEYIQMMASHSVDYTFTNSQPREKDSFGLDTGGRMMLVPASRLQELVDTLANVYQVPG